MASNAPRKLSHPTADAPPQVEEEQHTSETRSSSADWRSAACISCGATIQYITKGRRIGAPSRTTTGVVFLEDALLRPDPFSDARTGLPLQVGAVCSECGETICMRRACGLFYTRRFCAPCARRAASALPRDCRRLERDIFSTATGRHEPSAILTTSNKPNNTPAPTAN
jgi:hypothetical protein